MKNKKIVIAGGTGFIGNALTNYFAEDNEVVILTRQVGERNNGYSDAVTSNVQVRFVKWDGKAQGEWTKEIDGSDVVINLSGKSVNCRYNERNKKAIISSRVDPTKAIAQAIKDAVSPPSMWINASSATIYRHATDNAQDENSGEIEKDFSVQVCKQWEQAFFENRTPFTRKIAFRTAITLGNGGVMKPYLNLVKFGLGGPQGSGKQMFSWVHVEDVCRAVDFAFEQKELEGVFNLSSPHPVTNKSFMCKLRKAAGKSFGLPASAWMLKIGAFLIGTETELILKSRWVVPTKLTQAGFRFKYSYIEDALSDIVEKTVARKAAGSHHISTVHYLHKKRAV